MEIRTMQLKSVWERQGLDGLVTKIVKKHLQLDAAIAQADAVRRSGDHNNKTPSLKADK